MGEETWPQRDDHLTPCQLAKGQSSQIRYNFSALFARTLLCTRSSPSRDQGSPFRFFSESRRLPETKFRPKFRRNSLIPNGKGIQIQKTKFRWIPTEISVISTEISVISTGKWCQLWFSYCSRGQMKNFWIPTLFSFSRSTTFVSGTFSFEQWFESYLIISKTTI